VRAGRSIWRLALSAGDGVFGAVPASASGDRAIALAAACVWLRDTVEAREAAERVAKDERLAVEAENVVHFRVVRDAGWEDPR
jgi:hypothetical protein